MNTLKWFAVGVAMFLLPIATLTIYGRWYWRRLTARLVAQLESARAMPQPKRFDASELSALPPPVQRFFREALDEGMPLVAAATLRHTGTFNMGENEEQWVRFRSIQHVVTRRPGFVWDGRVTIFPGVDTHVHDAYVTGEGILHPAIAGVVSLADLRGEGELAQSELMRFFAEAAWYPTALLPSQGVRWEALDERSARATLTDGPNAIALIFRFGADGLIESVRAEARGRTVAGKIVPTPWEGRWTEYRTQHGMRIPMTGEVAWLLPEGRKPYWRGTIAALHYEFASP